MPDHKDSDETDGSADSVESVDPARSPHIFSEGFEIIQFLFQTETYILVLRALMEDDHGELQDAPKTPSEVEDAVANIPGPTVRNALDSLEEKALVKRKSSSSSERQLTKRGEVAIKNYREIMSRTDLLRRDSIWKFHTQYPTEDPPVSVDESTYSRATATVRDSNERTRYPPEGNEVRARLRARIANNDGVEVVLPEYSKPMEDMLTGGTVTVLVTSRKIVDRFSELNMEGERHLAGIGLDDISVRHQASLPVCGLLADDSGAAVFNFVDSQWGILHSMLELDEAEVADDSSGESFIERCRGAIRAHIDAATSAADVDELEGV